MPKCNNIMPIYVCSVVILNFIYKQTSTYSINFGQYTMCKPTRKIAQNPPQINKTTTLIEVYIVISAVIAAKMSNRQYMQYSMAREFP